MEEILRFTEGWFAKNNLVLNKSKTDLVLFHTQNSNIESPQHDTLNGCKYETSSCTRFLGIYVDEELDWKHHIQCFNSKLGTPVYPLKLWQDID